MNRVEKYHRQKEASTPPETLLIEKRTAKLQQFLFSEEWDFMYDSRAEAEDRKKGISPMSAEYIARVNAKRESFGISLLAENGNPKDKSSLAFCERIITELESIK